MLLEVLVFDAEVLCSIAEGLLQGFDELDQSERIGVEIGVPVYQDVDGPQLKRDWTIKTAWRWVY